MRYLITGGCGFLGSNIAAEVLRRREELAVFDNLSRLGATENLKWLESQGDFRFIHADVRNRDDVVRAVRGYRPDILYHLAGQVAMTTSIDNPRMDFEVNVLGTFNVLEAVREHSQGCGVLYSSTNKVYGDLEWLEYEETDTRYVCTRYPNGFPETIPLEFRSPYGTSKGSAEQYVLDYAHTYGLVTAVFRHSSMYGGRQFATYDQGWIGWFCQKAIETKYERLTDLFTVSGNGKQVRDVLFASDMVDLYLGAAEKIESIRGQVFNIGGGIANSLSLLELFDVLERSLGTRLNYSHIPPRKSDQKVFVSDISKARTVLGWTPRVDARDGIETMLAWVKSSQL